MFQDIRHKCTVISFIFNCKKLRFKARDKELNFIVNCIYISLLLACYREHVTVIWFFLLFFEVFIQTWKYKIINYVQKLSRLLNPSCVTSEMFIKAWNTVNICKLSIFGSNFQVWTLRSNKIDVMYSYHGSTTRCWYEC